MTESDQLLQQGSNLTEEISSGYIHCLNSSSIAKYFRLAIYSGNYGELVQKYQKYVCENIEKQKFLSSIGSINDRMYRQNELTLVQSQKQTIENLMKSYSDYLSATGNERLFVIANLIALSALAISLVALFGHK